MRRSGGAGALWSASHLPGSKPLQVVVSETQSGPQTAQNATQPPFWEPQECVAFDRNGKG